MATLTWRPLLLAAAILVAASALEECTIPKKIPQHWEDIIEKCQPHWHKDKFNYCYAKCIMKEGKALGADDKYDAGFDIDKAMEGLEKGRFHDEFRASAVDCLGQHGAAMDPAPADCTGYKQVTDCFLMRMCKECDFHGHCAAWQI